MFDFPICMSVATSLPSLESLPRPVRRRVRTLGHALTRLRAGLQLLHQQAGRGTLAAAFPMEWLNRWAGDHLSKPLPLPVDSNEGLSLNWQDEAWQVVAPLATEAGHGVVPPEWLVALLLLQLPALKAFWQRALRSQRFALLRRVLPQVWPLDLAPLPAGSTISGLGLSRWQDLPRLVAQGRCFEFVSLETGEHTTLQAGLTAETWQTHLDRASSGRWVLIEHVPTSKEGMMWASWSTHDGWVDLARLQSQPSEAVN